MEQQLLVAVADSTLSDLDQKYFTARSYAVRVALGGVECLTALRETPPDVLVLDTELKWGGADGVLSVMDEEVGLTKIPIVLLNNRDGRTNGNEAPGFQHSPAKESTQLEGSAPVLLSSIPASLNTPLPGAQVLDRSLKLFYLRNLLDSIGTATARSNQPRVIHWARS